MGNAAGQIVIAGGSGLIGSALGRALRARGDAVTVLTRRPKKRDDGVEERAWDGRTAGDWTGALDGARAVVNLAGRTVDCIKTPDHRDEILRSRVEATLALGEACRAYARLRRLARLGLGGTVGSGTQGMSWLHAEDMTTILLRAIDDETTRGVYVASGPSPVSNRVFMRALRASLGVPIGLPAPGPLVRLGAPLVLRTDPELALYGRYCEPRRLLDEGFSFRFGDLEFALADLAGR